MVVLHPPPKRNAEVEGDTAVGNDTNSRDVDRPCAYSPCDLAGDDSVLRFLACFRASACLSAFLFPTCPARLLGLALSAQRHHHRNPSQPACAVIKP